MEVVQHHDEYDAGLVTPISDGPSEVEGSGGKCVSGKRWTMGTTASVLMTPGQACMQGGCHTSSSKTQFTIAGTVYPLMGEHDDNDCNGIDGTGVAVVPMDDTGAELPSVGRIQLNAVGNFYTNKMLPPTFKVKVAAFGRDAVMMAPLTDRDGNCNYCHASGDFMGAKGRVVPKAP